MRNMSFALTTAQVIGGTKTVTRRMGWKNLKPGELIQPVRKCMGLKPGEKIEKLRGPIRIVSVRREALSHVMLVTLYGEAECEREGFPEMKPSEFVEMFCRSHKGCRPGSMVTRIEFTYEDTSCPNTEGQP
ncbi:MAG TPA: hypothetical protein VN750_25110 [Steroidobacteraceae bacterium]|nr:hypothetical protein [Steroidobacteraceae bacterium]